MSGKATEGTRDQSFGKTENDTPCHLSQRDFAL